MLAAILCTCSTYSKLSILVLHGKAPPQNHKMLTIHLLYYQTPILYRRRALSCYWLLPNRRRPHTPETPYTYRNNVIAYCRHVSFSYPKGVSYRTPDGGKGQEGWNPEEIANVLMEMKFLQSVTFVPIKQPL